MSHVHVTWHIHTVSQLCPKTHSHHPIISKHIHITLYRITIVAIFNMSHVHVTWHIHTKTRSHHPIMSKNTHQNQFTPPSIHVHVTWHIHTMSLDIFASPYSVKTHTSKQIHTTLYHITIYIYIYIYVYIYIYIYVICMCHITHPHHVPRHILITL